MASAVVPPHHQSHPHPLSPALPLLFQHHCCSRQCLQMSTRTEQLFRGTPAPYIHARMHWWWLAVMSECIMHSLMLLKQINAAENEIRFWKFSWMEIYRWTQFPRDGGWASYPFPTRINVTHADIYLCADTSPSTHPHPLPIQCCMLFLVAVRSGRVRLSVLLAGEKASVSVSVSLPHDSLCSFFCLSSFLFSPLCRSRCLAPTQNLQKNSWSFHPTSPGKTLCLSLETIGHRKFVFIQHQILNMNFNYSWYVLLTYAHELMLW